MCVDLFRIGPVDLASIRSPRRRSAFRILPAIPRAVLLCAILALLPSGVRTSHAAQPLSEAAATRCLLELSGFDARGLIRVQTIAYTLDQPGQLLVNLEPLREGTTPLDRLSVAPDPDLIAADPDLVAHDPDPRDAGSGEASYEVTAILRIDPERDLAWLEAPGVPSCATTNPEIELDRPGSVTGVRERNGYRPRLFRASIERTIAIPGAEDLLLVRIADGGGARTGFLFDESHRLIGSILPSPPYSDPSLACVQAIPDTSPGMIAAERGPSSPGELAAMPDLVQATPVGLFARALLLTRHDQADKAIGLLNEVAAAIGEFEELLLERGVRRFNAGRTTRAIEDFSRAAHLDPHLYLAHYNLGIALGSSGRYAQAADALERALKIDPDHPRALFHLALAHQASERPALAQRDYDLLTTQDPALAEELRQILGF